MLTCTTRQVAASLVVGAVALGSLGLAGCGGSDVKTGDLEKTVVKQFAAQGVPLTDVRCEDGVEAKVDERLSCSGLNPSGTKLDLQGRITAIKDGKASFRFRAVGGTAKGPTVASQALDLLRKKIGTEAKSISCPAEIPIPTKPSVTCGLVRSDGKTYDLKLVAAPNGRFQLDVAAKPR